MEGLDRYPIIGYVFAFFGSILKQQTVDLLVALLLGFVGAFGGWLFEQIKKKYLDSEEKKNKYKKQ